MSDDKQDLKNFLRLAKESISSKQYKKALQYCKKALSIDKKNYHALFFAGFCSAKLNLVQQAEQAYNKAIEIDPNNAQAWLGLVEIYTTTTEIPEKEKAARDQKLFKAYYALSELYKNNLNKWKEYIKKMIELLPDQQSDQKRGLLQVLLPTCSSNSEKLWVLTSLATIEEKLESSRIEQKIEADMVNHLQALRQKHQERALKKARWQAKGKRTADLKELQPVSDAELMSVEQQRELKREWRQKQWDALLLGQKKTKWDELCEQIFALDEVYPVHIHEKYISRMWKRFLLTKDTKDEKMYKETVINNCKKLLQVHGNSFYALELLLLLAEEDDIRFDKQYITLLTNRVVHGHPFQGISLAKLAEMLLERTEIKPTKQNIVLDLEVLLQRGLAKCTKYISGWVNYGYMCMKQQRYHNAAKCAQSGLQALKQRSVDWKSKLSNLEKELSLLNAKALFKLGNMDSAETIFNEILKTEKENIDCIRGIAEIQFIKEEHRAAKELYQKILSMEPDDHFAMSQLGWLLFKEKKYAEAAKMIQRAIELDPKQFMYHYRIARVYWEMSEEYRKDKKYCFTHFLTSAKLNPYYSRNFAYLGHYYYTIEKDEEKASKCYLKAVQLNPLETKAGETLGDMYQSKNQVTLAVSLYKQATSKNARAKWAWKRLGFYQLATGSLDDAALSFHSAIRSEPRDAECWEGLGEVYERQGKYLAALKAYNRAVEIDPKLTYSLTQIGHVHYLLGNLQDALVTFEKALTQDPTFVTAYKGLAETLFEEAKTHYQDGIFLRSAEELIKAQNVLYALTKLTPNMQFTWKLLGDVQSLFYFIPETAVTEATSSIKKNTELPSFYTSHAKFCASRMEYVKLGQTAYQKALDINPEVADNWFDLAVNCCYQLHILREQDHDSKTEDELSNLVVDLLKSAIKINPNKSRYWNALGFASTKPSIKQHAFIRALQLRPKNWVAWNNLGVLYLQHKEFDLAKRAFINAQNYNPSSSISWVGLAIINEHVKLQRAEGMQRAHAAFNHAFSLRNKAPIALGLGYTSYFVGDTLNACHTLLKYFQFNEKDYSAWNVLGLALEAQTKYKDSEKAFSKCIELLEQECKDKPAEPCEHQFGYVKTTPSIVFPHEMPALKNLLILARVNRARVLNKLGEHSKALEEYQLCKKDLGETMDFGVYKGLGLTYYHLKQYKEATKYLLMLYEHEKTPPAEKEASLVLLGKVFYFMQDFESSKKYFLKCIKEYPNSIAGNHAYAALGALTNNFDAAIKHIQHIHDKVTNRHGIETYKLESDVHLLKGDIRSATNALLKGIHMMPNEPLLWDYLASLSIVARDYNETNPFVNTTPGTASRLCSQLLGTVSQLASSLDPRQVVNRLFHIASLYYIMGTSIPRMNAMQTISEALKMTQKVLMQDPSHTEARTLLDACVHELANLKKQRGNYEHAAQVLKNRLAVDDSIQTHVALCENYIDMNEFTECIRHVKGALEGVKNDEFESTLYAVLAKSLKAKGEPKEKYMKLFEKSLVKYPNNAYSWMSLADVFIHEKIFKAAEQCLKLCEKILQADKPKLFVVYAKLAYTYLHLNDPKSGLKYIHAASMMNPESPVIHLLKGKLHFMEGDSKAARAAYHKAMSLDPSLPLANISIYKIHYQLEDWETAESDLWYEKDRLPNCSYVYYSLANFAYESDAAEQALPIIQKAILLQPSQKMYWDLLYAIQAAIQPQKPKKRK